MRSLKHTRALCVLAIALAVGACTEDDGPGAVDLDAGGNGPLIGSPDAGVDPGGPLAACTDPPPTALPRPPSGELPCELLPPGFTR